MLDYTLRQFRLFVRASAELERGRAMQTALSARAAHATADDWQKYFDSLS